MLTWKYIEGLSVVEIAERLGSTAKAAESLLTRARAQGLLKARGRQRTDSTHVLALI